MWKFGAWCRSNRSSSSFIVHYPSPSRFTSPIPNQSLPYSVMVEVLELTESILMKWDLESSTYVIETSLFYSNRREASEFIDCVNKLHKAMHLLLLENSDSDLLISAQYLMQIAMRRLEKEFYQKLSLNRTQLDPESVSTRSSLSEIVEDIDDEIRVAGELIMADLRMIAACMISSGYGNECVKIYKFKRKSIVDEGLYKLGVEKQKISNIQKLDWAVLDLKIKSWLNAMNTAVKTLFNGEKFLCDNVFRSSGSVREFCFTEITREGASILFGFPENVVKYGKTSPEKLFRTLDMYTVIADHWPEIESIFSFASISPVVNQALTTLMKLGESVRLGLTEFETLINKELSRTAFVGAGVHKLTIETMQYISVLADYGVLADILFDSPLPEKFPLTESFFDKSDSNDSPVSAVSIRLAWHIFVLVSKLDGKAKCYRDISHSYIFLANNLQHILYIVRSSNLRYLLGDDWITKQESKVKRFAANYERLGWSHLIDTVSETPTAMTPEQARDRFKRINTVFEEARGKQSVVVVPDGKLRDEIKLSIARKLLPAYREFYNAHRVEIGRVKKFAGVVKYAPDDMANALSDLFIGSSTSESLTSPSVEGINVKFVL